MNITHSLPPAILSLRASFSRPCLLLYLLLPNFLPLHPSSFLYFPPYLRQLQNPPLAGFLLFRCRYTCVRVCVCVCVSVRAWRVDLSSARRLSRYGKGPPCLTFPNRLRPLALSAPIPLPQLMVTYHPRANPLQPGPNREPSWSLRALCSPTLPPGPVPSVIRLRHDSSWCIVTTSALLISRS